MKSLHDIPAPAKLNLFLHITGRREDGYHLLQSAFALIDWCDTLHFELRSDARITREDLTTPLPSQDLIVRAAQALQSATGHTEGVHIAIEKRIPAQAGMGGGSSDAASTLLALNRLWKLKLSLEKLTQIGLSLGADIPFFLFGSNAWVEGIGDQMSSLSLPERTCLVIKPKSGLETKAIFMDSGLKRDTETATISGFVANPFGFGRNDLQPVAEKLCPDVTQALNCLHDLGLNGRMTGSGSAVFAWVPEGFKLDMKPVSGAFRLCKTLAVHPLSGWA